MKPGPVILLCIAWLFRVAIADEPPQDLSSKVTANTIDLDFAKQKEPLDSVVWDTFWGRPEQKGLGGLTTRGWRDNYKKFSQQLIAKAKAQGLDADSLTKCLEFLLPKEGDKKSPALLPIGAYLAKRGKAAVWVIVFLWEYEPETPLPEGRAYGMGHVRVWALDAKTLKQVAFVTCS